VEERTMKTASKNSGCQVFSWRRTNALRDHFALYASEHELAVLRIGGLAGPLAQLDAGDGQRLVFLSEGLAGRCICDASTKAPIAMYERNWQGVGGKLRIANGGRLRWLRAGGRWSPDRMLANADGEALVHFAANGTVTNLVTGGPDEAVSSPDLLLVVALGWLLIALARDRVR
ncbi:MAG: hypothetical protein ACRDTT_01895, partial [Pseudonocardiaceae bacterium]